MDEKTRQMFVEWGKQGGAMRKKEGKEYYVALGKKGALKRWGDKKKKDEEINNK